MELTRREKIVFTNGTKRMCEQWATLETDQEGVTSIVGPPIAYEWKDMGAGTWDRVDGAGTRMAVAAAFMHPAADHPKDK